MPSPPYAGTAPTVDHTPPSAPGTPVVSNALANQTATVTVTASTDNVAVAGYAAFLDGSPVEYARSATTAIALSGVPAGSHSVVVRAFDAAGNYSAASAATVFAIPAPFVANEVRVLQVASAADLPAADLPAASEVGVVLAQAGVDLYLSNSDRFEYVGNKIRSNNKVIVVGDSITQYGFSLTDVTITTLVKATDGTITVTATIPSSSGRVGIGSTVSIGSSNISDFTTKGLYSLYRVTSVASNGFTCVELSDSADSLPIGNVISILGGTWTYTGTNSFTSRHILYVSSMFADCSFYPAAAYAVPGKTSAQIKSLVDRAAIAVDADLLYIQLGANNILQNNTTPALVKAAMPGVVDDYQSIVNKILSKNPKAKVIIGGSTPMNASLTNGTNNKIGINYLNGLLRQFAFDNGYIWQDNYKYFIDGTTSDYKSGYSTDGLHPGNNGVYNVAKNFGIEITNNIFKENSPLSLSASESYTTYPTPDNLLANPVFAIGGAGTSTPDNWTPGGSATLTTTQRQLARADSLGYNWHFTVSSAGASNEYLNAGDISAALKAEGDGFYLAAFQVEIVANTANITSLGPAISINRGGSITETSRGFFGNIAENIPFSAGDKLTMWCVFPAYDVATITSAYLYFQTTQAASSSAEVKLGRCKIKKIG